MIREGRGPVADEPVVFVHGGLIAESFAPLSAAPADGYRFVRYHRRGYGDSTAPASASLTVDAGDCLTVLTSLDAERAHLVGLSYGAAVVVEAATRSPERVASLTLLEPPILTVPAAAALLQMLAPAFAAWSIDDAVGAVDRFHTAVWGPDWRDRLDRAIPGGSAAAERDAASLFASDLPALNGWEPEARLGERLDAEVLSVAGDWGGDLMVQIRERVRVALPQARDVVLAGADHSFPVTRSDELAAILREFLPAAGPAA